MRRRTDHANGPSRRNLLTATGAAGLAGLAVGAGAGHALADRRLGEENEHALAPARSRAGDRDGMPPALRSPTPSQVQLVAVDLRADAGEPTREAARRVLRTWGREIRALHEQGLHTRVEGAPTQGLLPASLGITLGLGASLLDRAGAGDRIPPHMEEIPAFATDSLEPAWCGGDLLLHVAAEDPVVASSAVGHLVGAVAGDVRPRWSLPGFQRSAAAADDPTATPRNLMGQIDGTVNPRSSDPLFGPQVLAAHPEPSLAWMDGGSYLVVRRIRMLLDDWYSLDPGDREAVIGRRLSTGAPLGGGAEDDLPDLAAAGEDGEPVIPRDAHIRLASPENTLGARMLRRGYSYDLGWDAGGHRQAGLIFTAWQADPRTGFTPVQRALDEGGDALHPYVRHEGSALFAVPPVRDGDPWAAHDLFPG
ncbi:Dyp-type peroxidase [Nocardiopsis sp. CT-R113]|uniref:Dyp-type peroxidase n=1 Tax=Nocardiopsis codii TaxID=3065942 RepID=A0ABU7K5B2_9ACTN|nr:Dyp-type peroxidase [Nocardiopsis sp. CT-R113]MEE2037427.1 Dyp-type peroxidase [Nocardiopsis sp. CT-R113]